jgi:hypothetical protein
VNPLRGPAVAGQTLPLYRRPSRLRRAGAILLGASGAVGLVACGGGSSRDDGTAASDWTQTDGAAGRINMDDVHEAYKNSFDDKAFQVTKFEERVNEIYEGDNLVIVKVQNLGDTVEVTGWEDLNTNKMLDEGDGDGFDDKLFTITQQLKDGAEYQTRGHGGNSYYSNSSGFGNFFAGMFLGQLLFGGRTSYIMPPGRWDDVDGYRRNYRSGSGYSGQQSRNQSYGSGVTSRFGSAATTQPVSPARSSYQTRQVSSGGFRNSTSTSRSITSGGRSAPITGGGGLMAR